MIDPHRFTNPDASAQRLAAIADAVDAVTDGRICIEQINGPFLAEGGTVIVASGQRFSGFFRGMTLLTPQHEPALRKLIQEVG